MAKITLPTNYRDDILNTSAEGKRKYLMSYNQDGTVSFEDVTPYEQVGSDFGAGDINATNEAINESFDKNKLVKDLDTIGALTEEGYAPDALAIKQINESLVASDNLKFQFATDGEGNYGYLGADDSFIPFSSGGIKEIAIAQRGYYSGSGTIGTAIINDKYRVGDTEVSANANVTYTGEYMKSVHNSSTITITALKKGTYIVTGLTIFNVKEYEVGETIYSASPNSRLVGDVVLAV